MSLRLVEIHLPGAAGDVRELLADAEIVDALDATDDVVRVLVATPQTEPLLDRIEQRFGHREGFRVVLLRVHATIPRPAEPEKEEPAAAPAGEPEVPPPSRISREELLGELAGGTRVDRIYLALVVLSAIAAAVGLIGDSVAIIIGAMVIAPLLLPNMAAALATTLGDFDLLRKSLKANLWGVGTAFAFALAMGAVARPDTSVHEIVSRTSVAPADMLLALASGSAGALAFTSGVSAGLVGVMVAVALLPPLVAAGLLLGTGAVAAGSGALLLVATNVICVNLAAVVTFLVQGVRPRTWWEADKARRATRRAVILWSTLLVVLAALTYATQT